MSPDQIELARHALGLPNRRRQSYRNHFVAGDGHSDYPNWMAMVHAGMASRRNATALTGGDELFLLTPEGARAALRAGEKLCPYDFPTATRDASSRTERQREKRSSTEIHEAPP